MEHRWPSLKLMGTHQPHYWTLADQSWNTHENNNTWHHWQWFTQYLYSFQTSLQILRSHHKSLDLWHLCLNHLTIMEQSWRSMEHHGNIWTHHRHIIEHHWKSLCNHWKCIAHHTPVTIDKHIWKNMQTAIGNHLNLNDNQYTHLEHPWTITGYILKLMDKS